MSRRMRIEIVQKDTKRMMHIQRLGISYAESWYMHYRNRVVRVRLYLIERITATYVSLETKGIC